MPSNLFSFSAKSGDWQRLALGASLLDPVVAATGPISAVPDLGHDALQTDPANMLEHLRAVDLETVAELNAGDGTLSIDVASCGSTKPGQGDLTSFAEDLARDRVTMAPTHQNRDSSPEQSTVRSF
jgi:hypothetical protein